MHFREDFTVTSRYYFDCFCASSATETLRTQFNFVLSDFVVFYTYELSLCLLYLWLYLRTLLAPWEEEIGNALEEEEQKQQQHVVAIPIFPPQFYLPLLYVTAAGELISMQQCIR